MPHHFYFPLHPVTLDASMQVIYWKRRAGSRDLFLRFSRPPLLAPKSHLHATKPRQRSDDYGRPHAL